MLSRKPVNIHVSYAGTFTNNLVLRDMDVTGPDRNGCPELFLDLSANLRVKNRETNTYQDARELAEGMVDRLELIQIDDDGIKDLLVRAFRRQGFKGNRITCSIMLTDKWVSEATVSIDKGTIFLRFKKAAEPGATDNPDDAQRLREEH